MQQKISIGKQNFADMRENKYFLIDKTDFIKEWWDSGDDVTLITRPRRFGKTLNMSMLECFFSNRYAGRKRTICSIVFICGNSTSGNRCMDRNFSSKFS